MNISTPHTENSANTPHRAPNKGVPVTRFFPEQMGFNPYIFQAEESLSNHPEAPRFMGFNAPLGLHFRHAQHIAELVSSAFRLTPEPDYVRLKRDSPPGTFELVNSALPKEAQVEFINEKGEFNFEHTLTLADFGMLLGATYTPDEPLIIVLGLTNIACGLKGAIQERLSAPIMAGVDHYCQEHKLPCPTGIAFLTQFQIQKFHDEAAKELGTTVPHRFWLENLSAWIEPRGIQKIQGVVRRAAPHLDSLSDALLNRVTILSVISKMNERQLSVLRQHGVTHNILGELKEVSGKWLTEAFGSANSSSEDFHTHAH